MKIGYSKTNKWFRSNPYGKKERVQETEEVPTSPLGKI
jgi:hypothetical protein